MKRRDLLAFLSAFSTLPTFAAPDRPLRAVILGHTGRGNYGHRLDRIFVGREDVKVVGVADPSEKGRENVIKLYPEAKGFADYKTMLKELQADLAVIAPRWTDQRHAMAMTALDAGAHLFMEKPFTPSLSEADEVLALAAHKKRRIAVAHQMLMDPNIQRLGAALRGSRSPLGALQEIRVFGKMDARAGAEDLLVLGTHLFDMVRWFGGDARWATAHILEGKEELKLSHARRARNDDLGLIGGTQIHAQLFLKTGIHVSFTSRAELQDLSGGWGFELRGSKSAARIFLNHPTRIYLRERKENKTSMVHDWQRWPSDSAAYPAYANGEAMDDFNRRVVDDWLSGIAEERDPLCSGERAMKSLEILHAILKAGLTRERVDIPLVDRRHPFATE